MALRSIAPAPLFREPSRSGRVRELGRLRRASTVEIHGLDIEEYRKLCFREKQQLFLLSREEARKGRVTARRIFSSLSAGAAFAMRNDKWDRRERGGIAKNH